FFFVLLSFIPLLRPEWKIEAKNQINLAIYQLPREAQITLRQYVEPKLNQFLFEPPTRIRGLLSFVLIVAIWSASGGMSMTMAALDRAYDVERIRPYYAQRPLAVLLTLIVATLILVVVLLIPIGTVVTNYLTTRTEHVLQKAGLTKSTESGSTP